MQVSANRIMRRFTRRTFPLRPFSASTRRPLSWRLLGFSLAGTSVVLSIPIFFYPFLEGFIRPWAIETALIKEKNLNCHAEMGLQKTCEHLKPILENAHRNGKIVLIKGPDASKLARAFASKAKPCGYFDFRTLFEMNAYESLSFQHIGWKGDVLNIFMKLAIFGSSIINGTMGKPESQLPYTIDCFNNLRKVLRKMRTQPRYDGQDRYLVFDNFGELVNLSQFFAGKTLETSQYSQVAYLAMMNTLVREDLCTVVLVWKNLDSDKEDEESDSWQSDFARYTEGVSEVFAIDIQVRRKGILDYLLFWL